jgi:hypothetical protein
VDFRFIDCRESVDPDQFYFGGHVESQELVENIYFRPNVEIGVGNEVTTRAFNFELAYRCATTRQWRPYVAAGRALNIYDRDGNSDSFGGFNIRRGLEHSRGLFGEIKFGTIDSPENLTHSVQVSRVKTSSGPERSSFDKDLCLEDPRTFAFGAPPRLRQLLLAEGESARPAPRWQDGHAVPGGTRRADHVT